MKENIQDARNKRRLAMGSRSKNAKLTEDAVRLLRMAKREDIGALACSLGISKAHAFGVRSGKGWGWLTDIPPARITQEERLAQCREAGRRGGLAKPKRSR